MKIVERTIHILHITVYVSDLIFFLKQRNVLTLFEKSANWSNLITASSPELWISAAFRWRDTPEGYTFWNKVNEEWLTCIKMDTPGEVIYENIFDMK